MKKAIPFFFYSSLAFGQTQTILDDSVTRFGTVLKRVEELLTPSFTWLFWSLVIISFAWSAIQWALDQTELKSFISVLVKKILFIGFGSYAFSNAGYISSIIIESFKKLAGLANPGSSISPSYLFNVAVDLMISVNEALAFDTASIFLILIATVILICYALIAGTMVVTLVECQFVAIINLILFAFSGSEFTVDYAKASWRYSISVGVKTFFIFLMGAIAQGILTETVSEVKTFDLPLLTSLLASSAILLLIITQIPQNVQSVIAGVTLTGNFNAIQAASQIASNTMMTAAGGAKLATEAGKYASAQSGGNALSFAKHAGIAIGKAAMSDFSNKASGTPSSKYGNFAGRMGDEIGKMNQGIGDATISFDKKGGKKGNKENLSKEKESPTENDSISKNESGNNFSRQGATGAQAVDSGDFSQALDDDSSLAFKETALDESDVLHSGGGFTGSSLQNSSDYQFSATSAQTNATGQSKTVDTRFSSFLNSDIFLGKENR